MDNNLSDINYQLKTLSKTSATNENDKCIKIIQTEPLTHTLNAGLSGATAAYIGLPFGNNIAINSFTKYLTQFNLTATASGSTFTLRCYFINTDYDEEIVDFAFTSGDTNKLTTNSYRNLNDMEIISGSLLSNLTLTAFPVGLGTSYACATIYGNSSTKYNCRYMCPRGKRAKLSSIDYYRTVNSTPAHLASDFSLQVFLRDTAATVSNPLFNYLQVMSPFDRTYNSNGCYNLEYGDSVMFYRTATTGAVLSTLSATFNVYDDGIY